MTKKLLEWNTVYRAYRVFPAILVTFSMYMTWHVVQHLKVSDASWDLGAVLGGMGILIERILSAYTKTGNKL